VVEPEKEDWSVFDLSDWTVLGEVFSSGFKTFQSN
jgi:hypothetical protein